MQGKVSYNLPKSIDDAVTQKLTHLLFAGAIKSNIFVATASVVIYLCLKSVIPILPLFLWATLMVLLSGIRFLLCYLFAKRDQSPEAQKNFTRLYIVVTAILGLAWSLLALLPNAFGNIYSQSYIIIIMMGLLFIAVNVLAMNRLAQILYCIPFPFVIFCLLLAFPGPFSLQFAALTVVFLVFMIWLGKEQHESLVKRLNVQFTNEQLISQLELAIERETIANRAKSEFLANMSHEIRTPMNGVLGMIELLQDSDLSNVQRRFADNIQGSGEILLSIINDILDFSKIEAGKLELESIPFDLESLIKGVEQMLARDAQDKGLNFAVIIPPETCHNLKGDPTRIQQVLTNLIANAIKFTKNGEVAIRVITSKVGSHHVTLLISVQDTGIGITPEVRSQLFKPFSQADGSTTRKYGGTGLGLAISNELVSRMGGVLDCESKPGKGSKFFFTIPLEVVSETEKMTPLPEFVTSSIGIDEDGIQLAQIHALVAEDNETNQEVVFAMLQKIDCEVTLVSNGQEAVDILTEKSFDLIFMDCQMPVMDGYQATAEIRRREKKEGLNNHIHIIALTANVVEGDREKCLSAGMDDYLGKPFKQDDIVGVLSRWSHGSVSEVQRDESASKKEINSSAVDQRVLSALRELQMPGKPDILKRIISAYLSSSEPLIAELRKALVVNNLEVLQKSAHSLKSSSANVGAIELSGICKKLEMDCRSNSLEDGQDLVAAIESEFLQVKRALNEELSARG